MLSSWRTALISAVALIAFATGGALLAQLESAERGILPIDSSGTLEVTGIKVDVRGKDSNSARYAGWRIAQREGFKALWAKSNKRPISEAPTLSDSTLDGLVSSIIIEHEQIGPNRYIAELGVLFDRTRAGALLGVEGEQRRSAPMLLIPLTVSGGTVTSVELRNHWQRAWAQYRTAQSAIDYVRVSGMGVDPLLVNAAQTRRPGRGWWRNLLDLYGAANVLVAEVQLDRLYPGGPARATFTGRFGPDAQPLGSFDLTAKDSADIPRMMAEGVARMDQLFTRALEAGVFVHDRSLDIPLPPPPPKEEEPDDDAVRPVAAYQLLVSAPDAGSLNSVIGQIRNIIGVQTVTERSLAIGGTSSVVVTYRGSAASLRDQIMARGLGVTMVGSMLRVTLGPPLPPLQPQPQPQPGPPPTP